MAMRIKFGAQIMNHSWFFSCSGRFSVYAPNIRCANKLAHYKQEDIVWSASPNCNVIAYSFCWRERKRKYVSQWQTARSKWKWTSIATVPDLCPTTVKILTHLISRYHLPLKCWRPPTIHKILVYIKMSAPMKCWRPWNVSAHEMLAAMKCWRPWNVSAHEIF